MTTGEEAKLDHANTLVSVYIPTKNRCALLRRAVDSVLAQTHRNIELIVVSDGSDDGTVAYLQAIQSEIPVRMLHNPVSVGACAARNQALAIANGHFVTGLDDDDYFMPHRIESFLSAWTRHQRDGVAFSCLYDTSVINDGVKIEALVRRARTTPQDILQGNWIGNQMFTTRERIQAAGLYDPAMPAWQDWDLWARLLGKFGPAININSCSYFMDLSHEFERISLRAPEKIKQAAALFYAKYCSSRDLPGLLMALESYPQITLTLNDLCRIFPVNPRLAARKLYRRKFAASLASSIARPA